jgi:SAM-dependent methyltransferase
MEPILRLFDGLDLCAPSDPAMLAKVLEGLPPDAAVLDAGCGRGADIAQLLAAVPQGHVTALDLAAPFIAHIRTRFADHANLRAEVADMLAPPGGPFDLIWAGGSAYGPGLAACLDAWRAHLKPGGRVALSDACWTTDTPAPEARSFWAAEYPEMTTTQTLETRIAARGWRIRWAGWLPASAWAAYYIPLEARMDAFADDSAMRETLDGFRAEIAIWRAHGDEYGYRLLVLEPT